MSLEKEHPMKSPTKMSHEERQTAIIDAAQRVFVEKGFYRTTTRELAQAAGVSEALLFKHFPNKEALYAAIQMSCFKEEGARMLELLESLKPSTSTLVFLVQEVVSHILGGQPDEGKRSFLRLVLRSLIDEGEFARLGIQEGPAHWVQKVEESIEAAKAVGDMVDEPVLPGVWEVGVPSSLLSGLG
jgi:AcrR family transcriptional regulator